MTPLTENVVVFKDVTLKRGEKTIFEGLNLSLNTPRIGLVGDNGSGKSSLLRLINGLLLPTSGRVITAGYDTIENRATLPHITGFVFQNPDHQILFPTVGEELAFSLLEQGLDAQRARKKVSDFLTQNGCAGWENKAVHELSEGQKQLVCLIAVLIHTPRFILLDEPFSSLDLRTRLAFSQRLKTLSPALIMASHDLDLLCDFDRILWLQNGKIRLDGLPATVLSAYREAAHGEGELHAEL
jgi:biotin transport system ATP-binding protein